MKAIIYTQYGGPDVLHYADVEQPTPQADEVLIKVHASSINSADHRIMLGEPYLMRLMTGLRKPKNPILGADVAGVIEAVGAEVTRFKVGDAVLGDLSLSGSGGYAEYTCGREQLLVAKPDGVTFEAAASIPLAGVTALQGLRTHGGLQAGQRVMVNGAASGVGSWAVLIAKALGAEVTAVANTPKLDMVRTLGADHVLDGSQTDITHPAQPYDLILDAASFRPFLDYRPALTPTGIYVMAGGSIKGVMHIAWRGRLASKPQGQRFVNYLARPDTDDLAFLVGLVATGTVRPPIERVYPLHETAEAMRHVAERRVKGKVVIAVGSQAN